jgi:curved DNA-binding protein CbpA
MQDYYQILGISRDATPDQIKTAYRKAALRTHPDRNQEDKAKEEEFKRIAQAYEILGDTNKKARYDSTGYTASRNDVERDMMEFFNHMVNFGREMYARELEMKVRTCTTMAASLTGIGSIIASSTILSGTVEDYVSAGIGLVVGMGAAHKAGKLTYKIGQKIKERKLKEYNGFPFGVFF